MGCGVVGWTQKDEDAGNDANTVAHKNGGEGDGADVALKFGQATTGSWGGSLFCRWVLASEVTGS